MLVHGYQVMPYWHGCMQDLTVCGCPEAPHELVDLATSVQRFTALRSLSLQPNGGITLSCVAALCSLQLLTRLTANLRFHTNSKDPVDLAEFTPLTGALPGPQQ